MVVPEFGVYRRHVCVKSDWVDVYRGMYIYRECDKTWDDNKGRPAGHAKVYYAIYVPDGKEEILTESFKTLKEAKKYIDYIAK